MTRLLVLALLAAGLPAAVQAQGLGAAAAHEKQKRQQRGPAGAPAFNDRDLSTGKSDGVGEPDPAVDDAITEGAPVATGASSPPRPATGGVDPAPKPPLERERHQRALLASDWRVRFANARERERVAETHSWREVVRTEFRAGVPVPMKIKEQVETEELKEARQALADLEEEFRKTGLPPGWAREP